MRFEDLQLLQRYARAQYRLAAAKVDPILRDLDESQVVKSTAYRKLRRWFEDLDPQAKSKARDFLRHGIVNANAGKELTDDHGHEGHGEVGSEGGGGEGGRGVEGEGGENRPDGAGGTDPAPAGD